MVLWEIQLGILLSCMHEAATHSWYIDMLPNGANIPQELALGHISYKGGGPLNPFGEQFRDHGYKWTLELCLADADNDSLTNGMELGDPCCLWAEGLQPQRTWGLSHPGKDQPELNSKFWNMSDKQQFAALRSHVLAQTGHDARRAALTTAGLPCAGNVNQTERFWMFYYHDERKKKTGPIFLGVYVFSPILVAFYFYLLYRTWRARDISVLPALGLGLLAVFWVEGLSGLLHIFMDNPQSAKIPGPIGKAAWDFQWHHRNPTNVANLDLVRYVGPITPGVFLAMCTALLRPRSGKYRLFILVATPQFLTMMMSHRWAHIRPADLPTIVSWLQRIGVLMSHEDHSKHHADYAINFSLYTGLSNYVLNNCFPFLPTTHRLWTIIFVLWVFGPVMVDWERLAAKWCKRKRRLPIVPDQVKSV